MQCNRKLHLQPNYTATTRNFSRLLCNGKITAQRTTPREIASTFAIEMKKEESISGFAITWYATSCSLLLVAHGQREIDKEEYTTRVSTWMTGHPLDRRTIELKSKIAHCSILRYFNSLLVHLSLINDFIYLSRASSNLSLNTRTTQEQPVKNKLIFFYNMIIMCNFFNDPIFGVQQQSIQLFLQIFQILYF